MTLFYGIRIKENLKDSVQGQFNLYLPVQKFIESICKDENYQKNKTNLNLRVFLTNKIEINQ